MSSRSAQTGPLFPIFERVGRSPGKYRAGFIDSTGSQIVEFSYDDARPFSCGLASVKCGELWGAVDSAGSLTIEPVSHSPFGISDDRIVYSVNGKRGIMSLDGKVIVGPKLRVLLEFQEGASPMSVDRLYGFVGRDGQQLAAPVYEDARSSQVDWHPSTQMGSGDS